MGASEVLHLPGTACEISPLEAGIVVHREEPGTTCTSTGSENRTKDFFLIPNEGQSVVG